MVAGVSSAAAQWAAVLGPHATRLEDERHGLEMDRARLAATRAELLRLGPDGISTRTRALRAEVVRREALAPAADAADAAAQVRERFAMLAGRYGVRAPSFEPVPVRTEGELQIGGLRVRAAGPYHAIGTWLTEALSDTRLLSVQRARVVAVPDSLTGALAGAQAPASAAAGAPGTPQPAVQPSGAAPLEAVVEVVVQWYARAPGAGAPTSPAKVETR